MDNLKNFSISEYFNIKRRIFECDVFYASVFSLSDISYSNEISTACVSYDKVGNVLDMKINPKFWEELNDEAKAFVIMHELSHIMYDHGKRMIALDLDPEISNIASDIVINHQLINSGKIIRELFDWKPYCWIETCFPDLNIPNNKNFEFYYSLLAQTSQKPQVQLLGSHVDKSDDNENDKNKSPEQIQDNIEDVPLSDIMKEILENNPDIKKSQKEQEENENIDTQPIKGAKEIDRFKEVAKTKENVDFKKLLKILIPNKKKIGENTEETWVGEHRRYMSFLKKNNILKLPNEQEREFFSKDKKEIWVFMDTSGSCTSIFPLFSKIIYELLNHKEVNCRAFSFDDDCFEIKPSKTLSIRASFGNNGGGFDCIEEKILTITQKEKIKYPDNVVVLSDGGVDFDLIKNIQKPKNWILLINNQHCKHLTPTGGKYIYTDNNFFGENDHSKRMKKN